MASLKAKFARDKTPSADFLVVGLGNPGPDYEGTRHNIGAEVVARIAEASGGSLAKSKAKATTTGISLAGQRVVLAVPTTYMNESGIAVGELKRKFGVADNSRIIVVHDELDLEVGDVRVKLGGGFAGHNGLKSINQYLKSPDFLRVRVGIDRPSHAGGVSKYVLSRPHKDQKPGLQSALADAAEAIELIVTKGHDVAMKHSNVRK